jgi:hypothetical protein
VNQGDTIALLLIAAHLLALGVSLMIFAWIYFLHRRARLRQLSDLPPQFFYSYAHSFPPRPLCWLAIRSVSPERVKDALGINRAAPCPWSEGMAGAHEFFISPQVHGWVIVTGLGLPSPTDDVDACFLFLTAMSRQLGHVQFFQADRLLHHHAWARLDEGYVTRAYAWTGAAVWQQGIETLPEIEIGVKTFAYGDNSATLADAEMNFEKVPLLAARWSLDPAEVKLNSVRQSIGIAGESARF